MNDYSSLMKSMAPTAYWRCDETSGSLIDVIAGHAANIGGTFTRGVNGLLRNEDNKAILGVASSYARTSTGTTWQLGAGDFSITAIIAFTSTAFACVLSIRTDSTPQLILITTSRVLAGDISAESWAWSDVSTRVRSGRTLNDGLQHHVTVTFNNTTSILSLYIDGVLVDARVQGGTRTIFGAMALTIGNNYGADQPHLGVIDEVAVFSRLLTGGEVELLHDMYSRGPSFMLNRIRRSRFCF